jgi:lactoylglutathione lyase
VPEVADPAGHLPALAGQLGAQHARGPGVRAQQARQHAKQRRLTRPVGSEHGKRGAARDADGDAGEGEALAVTALETVELDRRVHGGEAYADPVPRLVGINHVVLEVTDLGEALDFYGRVFDFELRGRVRGMAFIDMGDQFLVLAQERDPAPPDRERHFGLVVDDREAVRGRLEEIGARILGGRGLDFIDPWGNRVQVVEYGQIQFSKTEGVLRGMGLGGLGKSEAALDELREKGLL